MSGYGHLEIGLNRIHGPSGDSRAAVVAALGQVQSDAFSGGTGVSGFSGGRRLCHSVADSNACANARIFPSEKCGPEMQSPMGSPPPLNPHGMEIAGVP